ncbi:hypothetical protein L798_04139 [Zootermopsis nevadensis]|uniref:Uncharacterized protein n=1 Tax=Zootermopsis nevadensis TaxID=136037 RepID=A0A067RNX3_ZOONE|nr:hypothetical protein L798_04139 [Zootermopsis nevadensis]
MPMSAGRVFSREDIEVMLQLEVTLRGDARIAMKMAAQSKIKAAKQVREPAYIAKRDARLEMIASKSSAFQIRKLKDTWDLIDPGMERLGERIPVVGAGSI